MPKPSLALLPLALLALGCASTSTAEGATAPAPDRAGPEAAEAEKRASELERARLKLEIARLEVAAAERAGAQAVEEAQHELAQASLALLRFQEFERPSALEEARLRLDRSEHSLRQNEQELQEMEEMYAAEQNLDSTGERTRDIVLERHRKSLEFSTRQLELARAQAADVEQRELPRKLGELEWKVRAAQSALRRAEEKLARGDLEGRLKLLEAEARVRELERKQQEGKGQDQHEHEEGAEGGR